MKLLTTIARVMSALFSPLLMGTYGILLAMFLSYLCYSPEKAKLIVIAVTFVATCIVPVIGIFLLSHLGAVKDPMLNERTERGWPYFICILCYLGTGIYYHMVHAPQWLTLFMVGGAIALVILTIVNRWWKISGHATGMGALCAMVFFLMSSGNSVTSLQWEFVTAVILAGCVCTSRLILGRHTLLQVGAGFLNGFLCVFLPAWLLQAAAIPSFH